MKEFKKTYCKCLGESRVKTIPWEERRRLNNEKITRYMAMSFILFLLKNKKIDHPIKILFSGEAPKKLWGLSYKWCRTVILYRHSVWILLHEIAHISAPYFALHDEEFTKQLRKFYKYWKEFKDA